MWCPDGAPIGARRHRNLLYCWAARDVCPGCGPASNAPRAPAQEGRMSPPCHIRICRPAIELCRPSLVRTASCNFGAAPPGHSRPRSFPRRSVEAASPSAFSVIGALGVVGTRCPAPQTDQAHSDAKSMRSATRCSSSIATSSPPLAARVGPTHSFGCAWRSIHWHTGVRASSSVGAGVRCVRSRSGRPGRGRAVAGCSSARSARPLPRRSRPGSADGGRSRPRG
jgi:hypothetical protein